MIFLKFGCIYFFIKQKKQIRPSLGWPYIHTCRSYLHTPHKHDRHAIAVRLSTLNFTFGWVANSSDFELLGEQRLPAQDAYEPPCKI